MRADVQTSVGATAELTAAIGQKSIQRAVAEGEGIGLAERFRVPAQVVQVEPQGVARNPGADGYGELDEQVVRPPPEEP